MDTPTERRARPNGANGVVQWLLSSRCHRILSGSTAVIRYTGRRSGRTITTPIQYARDGSSIVIGVARPDEKTWWRNFREEGPIDILVAGTWTSMVGRAVDSAASPETAAPLLAAYLARFPKAEGALRGSDGRAVLVGCRPS
jgi:hypothetical protein